MKYPACLLLTILIALACGTTQKVQHNDALDYAQEIDTLLAHKDYFEARDLFAAHKDQLAEIDRLHIDANLLSFFNQLEASNRAIDRLFTVFGDQLDRQTTKNLLDTKLSNSVKLCEYGLAAEASERLLAEFSDLMKAEDRWGTENNNNIWRALRNHPRQSASFRGDSRIELFRDEAGLKNLYVSCREQDFPFIFDTGANLSTVIESQAEAMGIEIIEDTRVSVGTITGQLVEAGIGVLAELKIGNMSFQHVVFLVFPDEALHIPQINYQIKGILGFPVISAMKEIHFLGDEQIFVPLESQVDHPQNMAIEYLNPVIQLETTTGTFHFTFDTGADGTLLYQRYFEEHREQITQNYPQTNVGFTGGGGSIEVQGYEILFQPIINGQTIQVDSVSVLPQLLERGDPYNYGNIGQDIISRFDKMILNFEAMFVRFE